MLHRIPRVLVEIAARLLDLLLAGVGVELILNGLDTLKVSHVPGHP